MSRHAYLIMAHSNVNQLEKLIKLIDDERNDIYLHIDKKTNFDVKKILKVPHQSNIILTERIDVCWGGFSQVRCELLLLETALEYNYSYYHLISGVDLPLKSQDYIHEFFEKNKGKEFIDFNDKWDESRVRCIHLFNEIGRLEGRKGACKHYLKKLLNRFVVELQKLIKYDRFKNHEFYGGSNWFSITQDLAQYVINSKDDIYKKYSKAKNCDEIFLQSLVMNSHFKGEVFEMGNMRNIVWREGLKKGSPYTYRKDDYEDLKKSRNLFGRKFDESIDNDIVEMIYNEVSNHK